MVGVKNMWKGGVIMWRWNIYFRNGETRIRCPVEAPNIMEAIKEACRIMRTSEDKIERIQRVNKIIH